MPNVLNRYNPMCMPAAGYFSKLGIDVWVRRTRAAEASMEASSAPAATVGEASNMPAAQPISGAEAETPDRRRASAVASFHHQQGVQAATHRSTALGPFKVRCFRFGRVFVAMAEDAWPRRRYLLDVALAMNGFETAERRDIVFSWPQPGVSRDAVAAGRAFRAFFSHQTSVAARSLVSGAQVPALLGAQRPAATSGLGEHLYVVPETADAAAKPALWSLLQASRGDDH